MMKVREVIRLIEDDGWKHVPGNLEQHSESGRTEIKYLVIFEPTATGFSAYSPDLPGCVSTGRTREECEANMREAIEFHLDGLREEGDAVPQPESWASYFEIS